MNPAQVWNYGVPQKSAANLKNKHKRIYVPGGEGFIYVFQMNDPDHYRLLTKVSTALGGRTAGYFGRQKKRMHRFYLAVPARGGQSAEMRIYSIQE